MTRVADTLRLTRVASAAGRAKSEASVIQGIGAGELVGGKYWGRNQRGQLGDGTETDSATPMPVLGL